MSNTRHNYASDKLDLLAGARPFQHAVNPWLDSAIVALAAQCWPMGFEVSPDAPDTYAKLREYNIATGGMCVWNGASEHTIHHNPAVNYASRAWHDWCHLAGDFDFSAEGEQGACELGIEMLKAYSDWTMGRNNPHLADAVALLRADCYGQNRYKKRHGLDVVDQRGFDLAYMADPEAALADLRWAK